MIMDKSIKFGADLINDVSGFDYDSDSLLKLKDKNISKVLHHMQGTPNTMQKNPKYKNVLLKSLLKTIIWLIFIMMAKKRP